MYKITVDDLSSFTTICADLTRQGVGYTANWGTTTGTIILTGSF